MSTADHVLDQIDHTLGDYDVSYDAMRCAPDLPPPPAVRPRINGRNVIVQRLIDRHGLNADEAHAALLAAERGQDSEQARLAAAEAQAALNEVAAQIRAAVQPMIQRVADQFRQIKEVLQQLPEVVDYKPAPRRDRPAWQTPYGPPSRRR